MVAVHKSVWRITLHLVFCFIFVFFHDFCFGSKNIWFYYFCVFH